MLAAILFPAFASAREKARQIACLSNEKQMGLAVMQYAQDYDESIVPYAMQSTDPTQNEPNTAGQRIWSGLLQPYIKNGQNASTLGTSRPKMRPAFSSVRRSISPNSARPRTGRTATATATAAPGAAKSHPPTSPSRTTASAHPGDRTMAP